MKWHKRSETSIGCGDWIICRTRHSGVDMYTLHRGQDVVGFYEKSAEAKKSAECGGGELWANSRGEY